MTRNAPDQKQEVAAAQKVMKTLPTATNNPSILEKAVQTATQVAGVISTAATFL